MCNYLPSHLHSDISKSIQSILNSVAPLKPPPTCSLPHLIVKVNSQLPVAQAKKFGADPDSSLLLSYPALIYWRVLLALPLKHMQSLDILPAWVHQATTISQLNKALVSLPPPLPSSLLSTLKTERSFKNVSCLGFPGGTVVENLPADAGDTGSSPGPGRSHMPLSN